MTGPLNGHHFCLKHAAVVRQMERNVQVHFIRVDTASNPIPELRAVDIYIQEFRIRTPVIPIRNQRVEIPVETILSREIVNVYRGYWIKLYNSGVTRRYIARP